MSHESIGKSNEWYTPKYIFDALSVSFDLDVASPIDMQYCNVPANRFISSSSLDIDWHGFIWMNPPFGHQKTKFIWLNKFINHGNGIALTPDRTSAPWWQYTARNTDAVLFVDGKIKFIRKDGTLGKQPGNGTTLFGIGEKAIQALKIAEVNGLGKFYKSQ